MELSVAPCSRSAAEHAVLNWHYSQAMPSGRLAHFGVWERDQFIGAVIFGRGANRRMLQPFGLRQTEGCELVRVALREHQAPVSQIVAEALRHLRKASPGLRLVVSYADPEQGHHGGIYQAGGWIYLGLSATTGEWLLHGQLVHDRTVSSRISGARGPQRRLPGETRQEWLRKWVDPQAVRVQVPGKHRYVMPLDRAMRRLLKSRAMPYPDKRGPGLESETTPSRGVGVGATPAVRSSHG